MNDRPATGRPVTGRATWHRRTAPLPVAYLLAVVVVAVGHQYLPGSDWLLIHLLLLGAATNAILIWSVHFSAAILRVPAPATRRGEATRLVALNAGVVAVLAGGTAGPPWLGVAGAAAVFAAIVAHLVVLAVWLHRALPARFLVTVRFYLAAAVALLLGIPAGAWMLAGGADDLPRVLLFHAQVNLLGWVTLTVLGTLLTLWPTVLRTRMPEGAGRASTAAFGPAVGGVLLLGAGLLAWWPPLALAGLALVTVAAVLTALPVLAAARQRPPASFAAWSMAAGLCWLLVALGLDGWLLATAGTPDRAVSGFDAVLAPLLAGFVAQVLLGALAYLVPVGLGGGPVAVRRHTALLDRAWAQRVTLANLALIVYLLPVGGGVRTAMAVLLLVALAQFLLPASLILFPRRR